MMQLVRRRPRITLADAERGARARFPTPRRSASRAGGQRRRPIWSGGTARSPTCSCSASPPGTRWCRTTGSPAGGRSREMDLEQNAGGGRGRRHRGEALRERAIRWARKCASWGSASRSLASSPKRVACSARASTGSCSCRCRSSRCSIGKREDDDRSRVKMRDARRTSRRRWLRAEEAMRLAHKLRPAQSDDFSVETA